MGFWEQHAEREAALAPPPLPSAQDAPAACEECPHVGPDVLFGTCARCFADWEARQ